MTPWLYGRLTLAKEQTPPSGTTPPAGTPPAAAAPAPVAGSGRKSYIDAAAALVPADVLVFHAFVVGLTTETKQVGDEDPVTTVTDPFWLKAMLIFGCVWAIAEYAIAHHSAARIWDAADYVRACIPAAAFVVWMMLQRTTAFDVWFPNFGDPGRTIVAVVLVGGLGGLAKRFSDVADRAQPV